MVKDQTADPASEGGPMPLSLQLASTSADFVRLRRYSWRPGLGELGAGERCQVAALGQTGSSPAVLSEESSSVRSSISTVLLVPAAPPPVWGREGEGTCPQLCLWLDHLAPPSGGPQVANGQRIYISKDILHWQTVWASLGGCSLVCEQREGLCLPPAVSGANVGAL